MQKGEAIRKKIIETADALFYQQGFAQTSFTDISEALNMSKGNFYYYFKTKDEILTAVIEKRSQEIQKELERWDELESEPRMRLKKYISMWVGHQENIEKHGCPLGTICTELSKLHHENLDNASELMEVYRAWLEKQFDLLGYKKEARMFSLQLLARGQGIALITNTYSDKSFLQHEANEVINWIDSL